MAASEDRRHNWARIGARTRLVELREEISEILSTYPELRRSGSSADAGTGRRRVISAAARKAMSAGMRKYWARRKAEKAKAQKSA